MTLPPTPAVLSKMRFYLKEKLNDTLFSEIEEQLSPWPVFKLYAKFRKGGESNEIEYPDEDIAHLVERENHEYDCIDDVLNMLTRLENAMKLHIKENGILTTGLKYKVIPTDSFNVNYVKDTLL